MLVLKVNFVLHIGNYIDKTWTPTVGNSLSKMAELKKKKNVKNEMPKTLRKRFYYFFFDSFNRLQDIFFKLKHLYCGFLQFCLDWIEKLYITFCAVEIFTIIICNTKSLFYKYKHINIQCIFMRHILFQTWELGKKCNGNFILTFASQRSGTTALQR